VEIARPGGQQPRLEEVNARANPNIERIVRVHPAKSTGLYITGNLPILAGAGDRATSFLSPGIWPIKRPLVPRTKLRPIV
jgi:hypothetical protein